MLVEKGANLNLQTNYVSCPPLLHLTNLSYDSSLPLAHTSLCTLFSRLLEWQDGSHVCGNTWTCRDRDDAGGERYKAQSPRQGEPSFAPHLSPPASYDAFFILLYAVVMSRLYSVVDLIALTAAQDIKGLC